MCGSGHNGNVQNKDNKHKSVSYAPPLLKRPGKAPLRRTPASFLPTKYLNSDSKKFLVRGRNLECGNVSAKAGTCHVVGCWCCLYNLPSPECGTAYLTGYLYNIVTAIYLIIDAGGQPMKHQFLLAPAPSPEPTQAESEVKKCNDWQTTGDGDGGEAMTTLIIMVTSIRYQLLQLRL